MHCCAAGATDTHADALSSLHNVDFPQTFVNKCFVSLLLRTWNWGYLLQCEPSVNFLCVVLMQSDFLKFNLKKNRLIFFVICPLAVLFLDETIISGHTWGQKKYLVESCSFRSNRPHKKWRGMTCAWQLYRTEKSIKRRSVAHVGNWHNTCNLTQHVIGEGYFASILKENLRVSLVLIERFCSAFECGFCFCTKWPSMQSKFLLQRTRCVRRT